MRVAVKNKTKDNSGTIALAVFVGIVLAWFYIKNFGFVFDNFVDAIRGQLR